MNRNLADAAMKATQMKALLGAIEDSMAKVEVLNETLEEMDAAMNLLYLAEDVMNGLNADIEKLQGDEKVVDVITALHRK